MLEHNADTTIPCARYRSLLRRSLGTIFLIATLCSCSGQQSALAPAGEEAEAIYSLILMTVVGAVFIWSAVVGLLVYAGRSRRQIYSEAAGQRLILWGGVIGPALILVCLLSYALWLMPGARPWFRGEGADAIRIAVRGEQFWWRVGYFDGNDRELFQTANEIRIPVGKRIEFLLTSTDVIHSFWIPSLAGKMDMIPGRTNVLSMTATRPGIYRAPCAEFCGESHALMAFSVIVLSEQDFQAWIASQQGRLSEIMASGAELFKTHGCGACHAVRQIDAGGTLGPDLSNLGDRQTVGAGILPNTPENIGRFIQDAAAIKPGARMPSFAMLPAADIVAMSEFLKELQ